VVIVMDIARVALELRPALFVKVTGNVSNVE